MNKKNDWLFLVKTIGIACDIVPFFMQEKYSFHYYNCEKSHP
jgi:hypothetical protein